MDVAMTTPGNCFSPGFRRGPPECSKRCRETTRLAWFLKGHIVEQWFGICPEKLPSRLTRHRGAATVAWRFLYFRLESPGDRADAFVPLETHDP